MHRIQKIASHDIHTCSLLFSLKQFYSDLRKSSTHQQFHFPSSFRWLIFFHIFHIFFHIFSFYIICLLIEIILPFWQYLIMKSWVFFLLRMEINFSCFCHRENDKALNTNLIEWTFHTNTHLALCRFSSPEIEVSFYDR